MNRVTLFFFRIYIHLLGFIYGVGFCTWLIYFAIRHLNEKWWRKRRREKPPACLMDPALGRHGFAQLKDINIHYVENGDSTKPLLLFVHGFPEFWYSWRYQLKEFSKDYWTVAIDLRGYGDSDRPTTKSSYKMAKVIEDLRQFVLYLGREKATFISHDWGGLLLWNFIDLHLDMVERFVIISSPYHRNFIRALMSRPKQFINSWYCFFFQVPVLPEFGLKIKDFMKIDFEMKKAGSNSITDEDVEAYKYMFGRPGAMKAAINYYRANCGVLHIGPYVKEYPVGLMVFGEDDAYLETNFVQVAQNAIPNLRTFVLKNANHFIQQEHPERVNAVIKAYLKCDPFPNE